MENNSKNLVTSAANDLGYTFELCVTSTEGVKVASEIGAHRIELCSALSEGGLTPSYGMMRVAGEHCAEVDTKLNVLIRPRAGDFIYTSEELEIMRHDIMMARKFNANAVVVGCLTHDGKLDVDAMELMLDAAHGMELTFHRAFDLCADRIETMEQLIKLGVTRILTSGGKANALEGAMNIKELHDKADGRIHILAGAGVKPSNIVEIARISGIKEFHFSARDSYPSMMSYKNPDVFMGLPGSDEYAIQYTSKEIALETISALLNSAPELNK